MLSTSVSPSKCVTEPALEAGTLAASPMTKTLGASLGLQRVLVGGDEVQLVTQARRPADVRSAAVQGYDDGQVEVDLAAVVGDQPAAGAVDLTGVELGHQLDALFGQHAAQLRRRRPAW